MKEAHALVVRSETKVNKNVIAAAPKLMVVGRAGVGVDNVDVDAATARGIVVMNTPGGNTISTAELTFSMLMALARKIPQAHASMKEGKWSRKEFQGTELYNKTLGILGMGRIGTEVAKRAKAFGMKVVAYDPYLSLARAKALQVDLKEDVDDVYRESAFITVHMPMTDETRGMVNAAAFAKMPKGVRVLNCARGGIINEAEARRRRRKVEQEADFYGAMDGASKFVRGDAIAAILITLINVLGGFAIGIMQKGMSVNEALQRFTLLSIGDGLVSQIPALITSTAAGILVTRAAAKEDLGRELARQLLAFPKVLVILTAMLATFAIVPGLPMLPFLALAAICGTLAYQLRGQENLLKPADAPESSGASTPRTATAAGAADKLENLLSVDALQIELGFGLVGLADTKKGGDLLERVTGVRKTFAQEMGVIIPPIRLRDNLQLEANQYRFLLKGNPIVQGELMPGHWLAMNASNSQTILKGLPTVEPVFKLPATWIADSERRNAEVNGYTVVDASSVLVTHLSETVKRNCHEILSRQDVQILLDNLKQTHATVVSELIPGQLNVGQVQRILQNLLAEGVSIRNLSGILEKVSDYASVTKNPDELSEHARRALGPQIVKAFQSERAACRPSPWTRASSSKWPSASARPRPKSASPSNPNWPATSWIPSPCASSNY